MAQQPVTQPPIADPDLVPEVLCDGRINIHFHGNLATITFTHTRPIPTDLFGGTINVEDVVRARIAMSAPNVIALRGLLNRVIKDGGDQAPASGASSDTVH